jgi:hypothetical protein
MMGIEIIQELYRSFREKSNSVHKLEGYLPTKLERSTVL